MSSEGKNYECTIESSWPEAQTNMTLSLIQHSSNLRSANEHSSAAFSLSLRYHLCQSLQTDAMENSSIFGELPSHLMLDIARYAIKQNPPQLEILRVCSVRAIPSLPPQCDVLSDSMFKLTRIPGLLSRCYSYPLPFSSYHLQNRLILPSQ